MKEAMKKGRILVMGNAMAIEFTDNNSEYGGERALFRIDNTFQDEIVEFINSRKIKIEKESRHFIWADRLWDAVSFEKDHKNIHSS